MTFKGLWLAAAVLAGVASSAIAAPAKSISPAARMKAEAARVTIVRDDWGIAHVHGRSDADAVFGAIYAQAEDDFNRIEANYLTNLGRTAEADGETAIWADLRQRLFIDPVVLKADYAKSPVWLKALMDSWADGLNYYLATHPKVQPKVIKHFEPWMALSFTEGSIGGDIERVNLKALQAFYGDGHKALAGQPPEMTFAELSFREPKGSNDFAIAPSNTKDGHALLWINPHTSFYFRSELQMTSDQGLNAYGASTWGQFFIYQGFNADAGWMHTSSGVDVVDEFLETIVHRGGKLYYHFGDVDRPVAVSTIRIAYKTADGKTASRSFTVYKTHHGPIVKALGDRWVAEALMNRPIPALEQSYLRTKTHDYASFMKVAELKANSSNNTIFADRKGEIAYLHPQFIPRRDNRFDYTQPVDGADPATDWKGLHALDEAPHLLNPHSGWLYNTNNWPYSAAGADSPRKSDYPNYMDTAGENPRGIHADLVLKDRKDFTSASMIGAAFDSYMPPFALLIPSLLDAYDKTPAADPLKARLKDQVALLRGWDLRWGADSVATSLAVFWGEALFNQVAVQANAAHISTYEYMQNRTSAADKLATLLAASDRLTADFGTWKTPWGEINRFQRLDDAIVTTFHDDKPSIAVPFTSAQWGSLASFGSKRYPNTKRYYGNVGNSFLAAVEFGDKVKAVAVTAGGESGDPASPHFTDQAARYASGNLREVYFYPEQLKGHTERTYHPGGS